MQSALASANFDMSALNNALVYCKSVDMAMSAMSRGDSYVQKILSRRGVTDNLPDILREMDFSTDHQLQDLMEDQTVNPLLLAIEGSILNQWADRYFDAETLDGDDIAHSYRIRRFTMRERALDWQHRLAIQFMIANKDFAAACWNTYTHLPHVQGRVPFTGQVTAAMPKSDLLAVLKASEVQAVIQNILALIGSLRRRERMHDHEIEIEKSALANVNAKLLAEAHGGSPLD